MFLGRSDVYFSSGFGQGITTGHDTELQHDGTQFKGSVEGTRKLDVK